MNQRVNTTTVAIRGTSYQLRTDLEPDRLRMLAAYVDQCMEKLDPRNALPPAKVSVLASLSIAGDLWEARDGNDDRVHAMNDRIEKLQDILDEALAEG